MQFVVHFRYPYPPLADLMFETKAILHLTTASSKIAGYNGPYYDMFAIRA
jgi:hypothetical protein